jgi:hypothetical protein
MAENPFSRRRGDRLTLVHPKKPAPQELADEAFALALRCRNAGFGTTALLLEQAAIAIIASRWPLPGPER